MKTRMMMIMCTLRLLRMYDDDVDGDTCRMVNDELRLRMMRLIDGNARYEDVER